ncbi:MAG: BRO family protein [Sulfitobacter geojensis]
MTNTTTIAQDPFTFDFNGHPLRAFNIDGGPWLVAQDVCAALGIVNVSDAISSLDEDEKGIGTTDSIHQRGNPNLLIVNESGLYALAFKSRKPDAKAFRKWVTSIVLPAIRKDGMYVMGEEHALTDSDLKALSKRAIEAFDAKLEAQRQVIDAQTPKVAAYDARWDRKDNVGLTEFAKQMGLKPNKFTAALRDMKFLFNRGQTRNVPYAAHNVLFLRRDTDTGFAQTTLTKAGCEHFIKMIADGSFDAVKAA